MPKRTPDIYLEDMAAELGITTEELAASIERLVAQGWLKPLGNGRYQLTKPGPPGELLDIGTGSP